MLLFAQQCNSLERQQECLWYRKEPQAKALSPWQATCPSHQHPDQQTPSPAAARQPIPQPQPLQCHHTLAPTVLGRLGLEVVLEGYLLPVELVAGSWLGLGGLRFGGLRSGGHRSGRPCLRRADLSGCKTVSHDLEWRPANFSQPNKISNFCLHK